MVRSILGVVAGYAAMFAAVFLSFSAAYLAMGADRAFRPGSYDVSGLWVAVSLVLSGAAALAGGAVCAVISRGRRAPWALAALVVVLGILSAAMEGQAPAAPGQVRDGRVGNLEAMMQARMPSWFLILNPAIGAAGALAGAGLVAARRPATDRADRAGSRLSRSNVPV
jgi:hypothetical protein